VTKKKKKIFTFIITYLNRNDIELVNYVLNQIIDIYLSNQFENSPIIYVCENNNVEMDKY